MLRDGLAYLTRNEATEVQLALAVSLYAHSKWRHEQPNDRVKVSWSGSQSAVRLSVPVRR